VGSTFYFDLEVQTSNEPTKDKLINFDASKNKVVEKA
jgi:hypothetical protein